MRPQPPGWEVAGSDHGRSEDPGGRGTVPGWYRRLGARGGSALWLGQASCGSSRNRSCLLRVTADAGGAPRSPLPGVMPCAILSAQCGGARTCLPTQRTRPSRRDAGSCVHVVKPPSPWPVLLKSPSLASCHAISRHMASPEGSRRLTAGKKPTPAVQKSGQNQMLSTTGNDGRQTLPQLGVREPPRGLEHRQPAPRLPTHRGSEVIHVCCFKPLPWWDK